MNTKTHNRNPTPQQIAAMRRTAQTAGRQMRKREAQSAIDEADPVTIAAAPPRESPSDRRKRRAAEANAKKERDPNAIIYNFTYDDVIALSPCSSITTATAAFGGMEHWKATPKTLKDWFDADIDIDDIKWTYENYYDSLDDDQRRRVDEQYILFSKTDMVGQLFTQMGADVVAEFGAAVVKAAVKEIIWLEKQREDNPEQFKSWREFGLNMPNAAYLRKFWNGRSAQNPMRTFLNGGRDSSSMYQDRRNDSNTYLARMYVALQAANGDIVIPTQKSVIPEFVIRHPKKPRARKNIDMHDINSEQHELFRQLVNAQRNLDSIDRVISHHKGYMKKVDAIEAKIASGKLSDKHRVCDGPDYYDEEEDTDQWKSGVPGFNNYFDINVNLFDPKQAAQFANLIDNVREHFVQDYNETVQSIKLNVSKLKEI